jgi:hypothetical protein
MVRAARPGDHRHRDSRDPSARRWGRPVSWETIDPADYADRMRPHVGDHAADGTAASYRALAAGPLPPAPDPAPARDALGWAPRDAAAWARAVAWPVAQAA